MTTSAGPVLAPVIRGPLTWREQWGPGPGWATPRNPERLTFGGAVADVAAAMGTPLFPWQQYVVDVALEVLPDGSWAYDDVIVTAPRRAGKTFLIKSTTAHRCGMADPVAAWITAQDRGMAVRRWREVSDGLLLTPLRRELKRTISIGHEGLNWRSGSTFVPFAPSANAMHGEDPGLVWVDELWTFTNAQRRFIEQGYRPSFAFKPGQAWLMSAAGTAKSEWLNTVRREGRARVEAGEPSRVAFFEWTIPDPLPDGRRLKTLDDAELIDLTRERHPRRDHGLRGDFLASELGVMGRPDFLRAYGNVTPLEDDEGAFTSVVMGRARSGEVIPGDARVALAISVDDDRRDASIGVAWRTPWGLAVTDDRRAEGTRWVAGDIVRMADQLNVANVTVVAAGPARSIADELERAGVPLSRLSQADHAAACARFSDEFSAERPSVTWNGKASFADAVVAAEPVRRSSGLVWRSATGASVSSLDARALAVWSIDHAPEPVRIIDPEIY